MTETTQGQVGSIYDTLIQHYEGVSRYLSDPSLPCPSFLETMDGLNYSQVLTDSRNAAKGNPSMVSGALVEALALAAALTRDAGLEAKSRADFFSDGAAECAEDARFYGQLKALQQSIIRGNAPEQGA